MISGELLKYRNGFRIRRSYEQPLQASSRFGLTVSHDRLTSDPNDALHEVLEPDDLEILNNYAKKVTAG